jgi:hypothetical protein
MLQARKHCFFLGTGKQCSASGQDSKTYMEALQADESAMTENDTVGFEPTRGDPIGLAGHRPNRSAKVSLQLGFLLRPGPLREHAHGPVQFSCWPSWHARLQAWG